MIKYDLEMGKCVESQGEEISQELGGIMASGLHWEDWQWFVSEDRDLLIEPAFSICISDPRNRSRAEGAGP